MKYHGIMLDSERREISVAVDTPMRDAAYAMLRKTFPNWTCVDLGTLADLRAREYAIYRYCASSATCAKLPLT